MKYFCLKKVSTEKYIFKVTKFEFANSNMCEVTGKLKKRQMMTD